MRVVITYLLIACLLVPPTLSYADTEPIPLSVATEKIPPSANNVGGQLTVVDVPSAQEHAFVEELAKHHNVVFLTAKSNDPVNMELDTHQNLIFSAAGPSDMAYLSGAEGQRELEKVKAAGHGLSQKSAGLLVAFMPATGYGVYYWYMTSQYTLTAGAFAWEYVVAAALALGSRHWLKFTNSVGELASQGATIVASLFGKAWSGLAMKRWQRVGKIVAAYGLNVLSSGVLNTLLDLHNHDLSLNTFIFLFALFSSSEVVDYHSEAILKKEAHLRSAMIARLALYSGIELAALSGNQSAEVLAGTSVLAAIISFVFHEETSSGLHAVGRWALRKWNTWLKPAKKTCANLLSPKRS